MTKYSSKGFAEFADDDDDEEEEDRKQSTAVRGDTSAPTSTDTMSIVASVFPLDGRPFSAVSRQLLPQYFEEMEECFDEFGFRTTPADDGDDPTRETAPIETSQQRIKWLALLQFTHEHLMQDDEILWRDMQPDRLRIAPKFAELLHAGGVPHSLRPFLWPRLSGASAKASARGAQRYEEIARRAEAAPELASIVGPQIDKDLLSTIPTNYCFARANRAGTTALRRVLKSVTFMYPDCGYFQGMGVVVAALLLVCVEADVFWTMCALVEDILPANYYSAFLLGVRADERIISHLMQVHMPELTELIKKSDLNMSMITINWLITLLSSVLQPRVLFRVWDHLFTHGYVVIFRVIIAMLKMNEETILEKAANSRHLLMSDLFALIQQIPASLSDADGLLEVTQSFEYSITDHLIGELRKKHQAIILSDNGIVCDVNANLSKQTVNRRRLSVGGAAGGESKRLFRQFLHYSDENPYDADDRDDPRTKNVRQTEMIIDLRNAIFRICAHFTNCRTEDHQTAVNTQVNYQPVSDALDRERFLAARREGRRRARALLDFERRDADELGFRRGQLITIVSERDEHCWVGELAGQRGWFPAKFVEVVDERGKNYCQRGDEALDADVMKLTRGALALAIQRILCHGLRHSGRISTFVAHPWPFIETLASALVVRKNDGGWSRLTLCDTFKLDQDEKVLSPEELLFRAVHRINATHTPVGATLDAKLRSLVVFALNEQCLHLWFDIFCNDKDPYGARERYYHFWSFIRSPVAHQIKCELRLLAQFAFNLDVDSELAAVLRQKSRAPATVVALLGSLRAAAPLPDAPAYEGGVTAPAVSAGPQKQLLKESVRDMLIKHHLFSWDL